MLTKQAKATKKMTDDSCRYAKGARAVRYPRRLYHHNQILHAFRKKIPYLQEVFKKASRKGGKSVQKLLTHLDQSASFSSNIDRLNSYTDKSA